MIIKNEALEARLRLTGTNGEYVPNPSFTAGEVQIWTDSQLDEEGNPVWTNVANLPQQIGESEYFLLTLTTEETNHDWITIRLVSADQQWDSLEAAVGTQIYRGGFVATPTHPQPVPEQLRLIRGDLYDGVHQVNLVWDTTKEYSNQTATLIVFDNDGVIASGSGTADGNIVTIASFLANFDEPLFNGNPKMAKMSFAVVVSDDSGGETIQFGKCLVHWRPDIPAIP